MWIESIVNVAHLAYQRPHRSGEIYSHTEPVQDVPYKVRLMD